MRILTHKITMEDGDIYAITNAVKAGLCPDIPSKEHFSAPALCIKSEPFPEGYKMCGQTINFDKYVKAYFDEKEYPELKDNYLRAIHGKLDDWKLIMVNIERNHIQLTIGKSEEDFTVLEIVGAPSLYLSVEAPALGGKSTDKYIIHASMGNHDRKDNAYNRIVVSEFSDGLLRRDVFFSNNGPDDEYSTRAEWINAAIAEYQ